MINFLNKGNKFSIDDFNGSTKKEFIKILGTHFVITPNIVEIETKKMLSNVAIDAEIKTAISTYKKAKEYLTGISHNERLDKIT